MTHTTNDTAEYNGHRSYEHWNVSLWMTNDEGTYDYMVETLSILGSAERAAEHMAEILQGTSTPDGVPYTLDTILHAMTGLV